MQTIALSEAALALFRRRISGERVEVANDNRALYRELAAAGLMEPPTRLSVATMAITGLPRPGRNCVTTCSTAAQPRSICRELPRCVAHRPLCFRPGDESQFVVAAVFVLGQFVGDDRRARSPRRVRCQARRVSAS